MAWPGHIKEGISAQMFQDDIIMISRLRIDDPMIGAIARQRYELIHAHARLDRENHAHGLLRTLVNPDGTGVGNNDAQRLASLDSAWDHVKAAYDRVMLPAPNLVQLSQAVDGVDHGGGGGIVS